MEMYRAWFPGEQDSATDFAANNMDEAKRIAWDRLECDVHHYTTNIIISDEAGNRQFYSKPATNPDRIIKTLEITERNAPTIQHALEVALWRGSYTEKEEAELRAIVDDLILARLS